MGRVSQDRSVEVKRVGREWVAPDPVGSGHVESGLVRSVGLVGSLGSVSRSTYSVIQPVAVHQVLLRETDLSSQIGFAHKGFRQTSTATRAHLAVQTSSLLAVREVRGKPSTNLRPQKNSIASKVYNLWHSFEKDQLF